MGVLVPIFADFTSHSLTLKSEPAETISIGPEEIILTADQRLNLLLNWFHNGILGGWKFKYDQEENLIPLRAIQGSYSDRAIRDFSLRSKRILCLA
jgi:hypothetical protein